jgi:hypothetical protein
MKRTILGLALVALVSSAASQASAQLYRSPVACTSCIGNYYYYDHILDPGAPTATEDWNCGASTYDDHRGSDFSLNGGNAAIDTGYGVVSTAVGTVIVSHDGEEDHCTACGGAGCGTSSGYGYGNYVTINYGDRKTTFAHMRRGSVRVAVGDTVTCGQELGQIGSAGCSTGAHLHVELRTLGGTSATAYDPFHGSCSSRASTWVDQRTYRTLPAPMCEDGSTPPPTDPPPSTTCPSGTYAIWTCLSDLSARRRCISGVVTTETCSEGCLSRPVGTDDVCAAGSTPPPTDPPPTDPPPTTPTDGDADGYPVERDCDDTDARRHPGAAEICGDAIDQDCDGSDCSNPIDAGTIIAPDGGAVALDAGAMPRTDAGTAPPGFTPGSHAGLEGGCSVGHAAGGSARGALVALLLGLGGLLLTRRGRSARRQR